MLCAWPDAALSLHLPHLLSGIGADPLKTGGAETNMWQGFPLFPEVASTIAASVDALYFFLTAVTVFFSGLIFVLIFYFAVKYRRRPGVSPVQDPEARAGRE